MYTEEEGKYMGNKEKNSRRGEGCTHLIFLRGGEGYLPLSYNRHCLTPDPSISVFAECYATEFNQFTVNLTISIL